MIIFAAVVDLKFLSKCEHWFASGTFIVIPSGYDQLYMIHGFFNGDDFPAVYALLYARTEEIYQFLLQEIQMLKAGLNPISITVDFELAAIQAFQNMFATATFTGCMFHFGQCVWRKLQSVGFSVCYRDEPDFVHMVKCLRALAIVPPDDVIKDFEKLTKEPAYCDIEVICDYMEDNFIGRSRRGKSTKILTSTLEPTF